MLRGRKESQRGQILLLACFAAPVTFALVGLVVDVGWMYWRQEACLTAAQAASLAGVAKIASLTSVTCTTSGVWCSATPTQCPKSIPSNNFGTACRFANANSFVASNSNQNVTVAANVGTAPTVSGASTTYYMTVRVTEKHPLTFLSVLTRASAGWVSARATAAIVSTPAGSCVYILDPTGSKALNANNNAQVSASCGVWDYSTANDGLYATGSAKVKTTGTSSPPILYTGNGGGGFDKGYDYDNSGSISPTPTQTTGSADPLASLPVPWTNCLNPSTGSTLATCPSTTCQYTGCAGSSTHCDSSQKTWSAWQATPFQFSPGVYCGGISVSNGMGAYFAPGMYVINGGGVNLNGSNTYCVGNGSCSRGSVVFYLTGTNSTYGGFTVGNGSTATFTAPTAGDLAGVLIYQDRSLTPSTSTTYCSYSGSSPGASSFCGGSSSTLTGIMYLPSTTAAFTNGTGTGGYLSLVVKDAVFNGGSYVLAADPYGTLPGASGSVKSYLIE